MDKKTIKKQEIIKKSIRVMYLKGYNGTGVKDLTDAAGIPKGSLYNYFENKEDYAKEALYYFYNEMNKDEFAILENEDFKPLERVKKFYQKMISAYEDETNFSFGCFVGNLTQEMGGVSSLISEATNDIHSQIAAKINRCLESAKENGELKEDKDSDMIANFIVSSWQGTLLRIKVSKSKEHLNNFYRVLEEVLLK